MSSAIVTGATGILGRQIVHALGQDPSKWLTVHALSRSQKEQYPSNVKHDTIDLSGNAKDIAKQLHGVEGEYIFFTAYLQKDSEQAAWDVNGDMLQNFLEALSITGVLKAVKRIILVTGAKQYGLHLGCPKNPMLESDPRIDGSGRPPNFYYRQQDILKEYGTSNGYSYDWVVTYPNDVIGQVKTNFMNLTTPLALYAVVCKELGGSMPWPGNETFYHCATSFTDTKLHAEFCLWAALEPRCSNQCFNVVNGDTECWENLWPKVAAHFGTRVPKDQFAAPADKSLSSSMQLADKPAIADFQDAVGLQGSNAVKPSLLEARIDVEKWAQREDVKAAWKKVAEREGLDHDAFAQAPWWFLRFILGRNFNILISMSKARELGWTGYKDTWQSLQSVFRELEGTKVLPKQK